MKSRFKRTWRATLLFMFLLVLTPFVMGAEEGASISIKDHRFSPSELIVPAGQKIKLTIVNQDPTSEEFESFDLNREEIVEGHETITVFIGPLKPGKYEYFGEFNQETAQGVIIAQ